MIIYVFLYFLLIFCVLFVYLFFFFFNDTATTEIYTLSLHDAPPILGWRGGHQPSRPELSEHDLVPEAAELLRVREPVAGGREPHVLHAVRRLLDVAEGVPAAREDEDAIDPGRQLVRGGRALPVLGRLLEARDRARVGDGDGRA